MLGCKHECTGLCTYTHSLWGRKNWPSPDRHTQIPQFYRNMALAWKVLSLLKTARRIQSSSFQLGQSKEGLTTQEKSGQHLHHFCPTVLRPCCPRSLPGAWAMGTPGVACQKPLGTDVLHYSIPTALGSLLHLLDKNCGPWVFLLHSNQVGRT